MIINFIVCAHGLTPGGGGATWGRNKRENAEQSVSAALPAPPLSSEHSVCRDNWGVDKRKPLARVCIGRGDNWPAHKTVVRRSRVPINHIQGCSFVFLWCPGQSSFAACPNDQASTGLASSVAKDVLFCFSFGEGGAFPMLCCQDSSADRACPQLPALSYLW